MTLLDLLAELNRLNVKLSLEGLPDKADLPGSRRLLTIDQGSGLQIIPFNVVLGMVQGEGERK